MEPEPEAVEQAYETELAAEDSSKRRYLVCSTCRFPIAGPEDLLLERIECWRPAVFQYLFSLDEGHVIEEESETGGAAPERGDHGYPDGTLEPLVVWAYSATNPTSHRFDVVRIRPTPAIKFERPRGGPDHWTRPTPDHCWFPGTAWRQAYCAVCGDHMGWGYSAWTEESASGSAQGTPQGSEALPSPTSASPTESNGSAPSPTSPTYIANSEAPVLFVGLILTRVVPSDLGEAEVACFVRERNDFALNPVFNNRR
ncbi:hypothetical protein DFJ74DRAFT_654922 [Hyaloraphidium curvatum]|nr:hypothetical protein DFJ74DRAFT_654922 [Hyaloraphidium curvatum]